MANFFKAPVQKQKLGQQLTLTIDKLDPNGTGVAQYQKKSVFIAGALPYEKVTVKVVEQKSKFAKAQLLNVDIASEDRVTAKCSHFLKCGGCELQHLDYSAQVAFKQQKVSELFSRNDFKGSLPWQAPITSSPYHYRRKARIGVQYDKKGHATIGFRRKGTNQLAAIKQCPVLFAELSGVFTTLKSVIGKLSQFKSIGHIEVIATDIVTLVIRQLVDISQHDRELWLQLCHDKNWQIILDDGKTSTPLTQAKPLSYQLADNTNISFEASDFIQVNADVNNQMIETAITWLALKPNDQVLDLFCGLGNFSLPIAKQVASVVGIEGVQNMVIRAEGNALKNGIENCHFYQADLSQNWQGNAWSKHAFSKILLDPARAGALEAMVQITQYNVEKILYVSCDPATLARDSKVLALHGYHIEKIMVMDMFSQTKHVETMVLFSNI